jgi:hypothetical protein
MAAEMTGQLFGKQVGGSLQLYPALIIGARNPECLGAGLKLIEGLLTTFFQSGHRLLVLLRPAEMIVRSSDPRR